MTPAALLHYRSEFRVTTAQRLDTADLTAQLAEALAASGVRDGTLHAYTPHATAAIIINENYDPNICLDLHDALSRLAPQGRWRHDRVDGNADAHIKASLLGPSETIPVADGELRLGTWQSPMLIDLDGPKARRVVVTIIGSGHNGIKP